MQSINDKMQNVILHLLLYILHLAKCFICKRLQNVILYLLLYILHLAESNLVTNSDHTSVI